MDLSATPEGFTASKPLLCRGDDQHISETASHGYRAHRAVQVSEDGNLWARETGIWESRGRALRRKFFSIAKSLRISKGFKSVNAFSKQLLAGYVPENKENICGLLND